MLSCFRRASTKSRRRSRAAVALYAGLVAPALTLAVGLGADVANWSGAKVDVQRVADTAATAGAISYKIAGNSQTAAAAAANLAEINGAAGAESRTWNSSSNTLSDNQVTVQVTNGVVQSSNTALRVTVRRSIPIGFGSLLNGQTSVTVSATSVAELLTTSTPGSGGQPCLVALVGNNMGIIGINVGGSSSINASQCTLRSNGGVKANGGAVITAQAIYTAGTITNVSATINAAQYPNDGVIPDPYASNNALQTALTNANSAIATGSIKCTASGCTGPGTSVSCTNNVCTINPGTYSGFAASSNQQINFAPGMFVFTGNVTSSSGNTITGNNVTIIVASSATFNISASNVSLTAASPSAATNGQIAGVVLAGRSTANSKVSGSTSNSFLGTIYYPNGALEYDGGGTVGTTTGCSLLVAYSITVNGSTSFNDSQCATVGTPNVTSIAATTTLTPTLVQ